MVDGPSSGPGEHVVLLVEEEPGSGFETARSPAPPPDLDALENHMLWNSATQKSVLKRVGFGFHLT